MTPETFAATLGALRHAGSVYGLVLSRRREVLYQDAPCGEARATELAALLDEISCYFEQERRSPDQLFFGYDGGQLLILLLGEFRMVVFHREPGEVDFVARAGRAFLKDYAMDQRVREFAA